MELTDAYLLRGDATVRAIVLMEVMSAIAPKIRAIVRLLNSAAAMEGASKEGGLVMGITTAVTGVTKVHVVPIFSYLFICAVLE